MSRAAGLPVLSGILAVLCARPAFGQVQTCSGMSVEADAVIDARWPGLSAHLHDAFEARREIDRCARVRLSVRDTSIIVEVILPDGRSATRSVIGREDLVPTLEALLLVPERAALRQPSALDATVSNTSAANPLPSPSSVLAPSPLFDRPLVRPARERDTASPASGRQPSHLRIELSAATGARIGGGQASFGLGVLTFLEISRWLVGFEGRVDRYAALTGGAPSGGSAVEFAILGGRRFYFHRVALDLAAGPALVPQGTASFQAASSGHGVSASNSSIAPRLVGGPRVNFSPLSTLHTFISIDGELGAARLGEGVPGAPQLPIWTVGLALGATVGTQ
jgi:hypothetical protein